ncbi:MAG TPA: uroporphyrinogen-III C-methyltransferase [Gemmata sp.]|nr:uroporphyrinogen-III C-methyltransferase [Gemmata sp.]
MSSLDPNPIPATVYLVGAGPGAADLITVRALRILRSADVVCHDALVAPELLAEAKPGVELVHVGKRGYCVGSTRQEHINELLVRYANAGKTVCRLKGGDPFIFGRGGEEAEALAAAGVPFEVVPGVTAALAACASARIPLTHRAAGQSVAFVTGHHDPDSPECTLDWGALSRLTAIVFYMAVRHIGKIAVKLCDSGMSPMTPAAIVEAATTPRERVIVAPLAAMGDTVDAADIEGPALFIVGEPVSFRSKLASSGVESVLTGIEIPEPVLAGLRETFGGEQ